MREFEFTVRYDAGADDLMDLFIDTPSLRAQSQTCFANDVAMWRVDHLSGPPDVLDRVDDVYLDESVCNECLDLDRCDSAREYHVMEECPDERLVYTRRIDIDRCHSIPSLAVEHVGDGVLLDATRSGEAYVWRVLMPEASSVGELYDAVEAKLRSGLSLELGHVSEQSGWTGRETTAAELTAEERQTLEAAVADGYYRTPRETTVEALGERLAVPRSTVQYRLQRAEQKVMNGVVENRP